MSILKKNIWSAASILCLLLLSVGTSSCKRQPATDRPVLTVSIEPLRYVVEAIAGEHFSVETLMPQGASPETYEPTPRQMTELSRSVLLFRVGTLGFEQTRLEKMASETEGLTIVNLSDGISQIEESEHAHGASDSTDPHVWTSPRNLCIMARNACRALTEKDRANAADYKAHLLRFEQQISALDSTLQRELCGSAHRAFLIYHPALGYFAEQYGLSQISVEQNGKEPSVAGFKSIISRCKAEKVNTVFVSKEHSGKAAHRIADALKLEVTEINPLAYDIPAELLKIAKSLNNEHR